MRTIRLLSIPYFVVVVYMLWVVPGYFDADAMGAFHYLSVLSFVVFFAGLGLTTTRKFSRLYALWTAVWVVAQALFVALGRFPDPKLGEPLSRIAAPLVACVLLIPAIVWLAPSRRAALFR